MTEAPVASARYGVFKSHGCRLGGDDADLPGRRLRMTMRLRVILNLLARSCMKRRLSDFDREPERRPSKLAAAGGMGGLGGRGGWKECVHERAGEGPVGEL